MASKIKLRRDTASIWQFVNPLLSEGEPGLELDTAKIKYGNGVDRWNDLPYSYVDTADFATAATYSSVAGVATALQTPRSISISGDLQGTVLFDGTSDVSIAATIQPNSVALGSDTTGDYVQSISGTTNQISISGGSGEGSIPTLSIPNQFTAPRDVTVSRDLQVSRNLNVDGNITIGGTSATLFTSELKVADPDIVLGIRTDGSGNDISTDNTANHGGIAIASTEGSPLVQIYNPIIGETNPATYKKIMWFKSGSFVGLNTDAWLINYAVGIGSTQFPSGTRLAVGSVQFTQNDLLFVRNINASGIVTASSFSGSFSGSGVNLTGIVTSISVTGTGITATQSGGSLTITGTATTVGGSSTYTGNNTFSGITTFSGNVVSSGVFQAEQVVETYNAYTTTISSGNPVVPLDCSSGNTFYITSNVNSNWTANLTNLNLPANTLTNVTLLIVQGVTAYMPIALQIGGVAQTINWQGGSLPMGNNSRKDAIAFTIFYTGSVYNVFGQLVSFG